MKKLSFGGSPSFKIGKPDAAPITFGPGGGASFGFAFLRMAVVEGGSPTIVRAAITEGGALRRLQIKDK